MKNKINFIAILALVFSFGLLTSCDEKDDLTGASTLEFIRPTVTLSSLSNNAVISEMSIDPDNPDAITVTATIDQPIALDIKIPLVQTSGNASSEDYTANAIIIRAGRVSGSTQVIFEKNGFIEGNETLTLQPASIVANAEVSAFSLNVSIEEDYITDFLDIEVSWDGTVSDSGLTIDSFCDMDLDLLFYDATFDDIGVYDAATGACPEALEFGSGIPDGIYYAVANLYDNIYSGLGLAGPMPITLNYSQANFDNNGTITIDDFTTDTPSGSEAVIAIITKTGYNYTVTPF